MTRRHHRALSTADRSREILEFSSATNPLDIFFSYQEGSITARDAHKKLSTTTVQGILWAGEIALEQAYSSSDETSILNYLYNAKKSFDKVEKIEKVTNVVKDASHITSRAKILNAHLPIQAVLSLDGRLPTQAVAEKAYQQTVGIGYQLALELNANRDVNRSIATRNMVGTLGEFAVYTLLERIGVQTGTTHNWFPLLSYLTEDRRNTPGSSLNHGWDISVFSDMGKNGPTVDHRIQVKNKSSRNLGVYRPDEDGIISIRVEPDLRIKEDEHRIAIQIMKESFVELTNPTHSEVASYNLDQRQYQLLRKISA